MSYTKKRIAILLALLLVVPTLLNCIPCKTLVADAATVTSDLRLYWTYSVGTTTTTESGMSYTDNSKGAVKIEAGQNGYIGSLAYASDTYGTLSTLSGVTYTSDNPAVATVGKSDGLVKTITAGTANITITYKGLTTTCALTVVAKGSLGSTKSDCAKINNAAKALIKTYGSKVTTKNRYKLANELYRISTLRQDINTIDYNGLRIDRGTENGSTYVKNTNEWIAPYLSRYSSISSSLSEYVRKINPIGTVQSKHFKISKASGKGDTINLTLKKKVTADQIFAIQQSVGFDTKISASKTTVFPMYVQDKADNNKYYALATVTKGSKKVTIKLVTSKLQKKHTYRLIGRDIWDNLQYGWTKGKTFKAK